MNISASYLCKTRFNFFCLFVITNIYDEREAIPNCYVQLCSLVYLEVALSLAELHVVHSLSCVPVQEGFPPEHLAKLVSQSDKHLLHCCAVPCNCTAHFII